jgi:hypothetical protein
MEGNTMKLITYPTGAHGKMQYAVTDDHEAVLAVFDDLERAGVLLRYLRGAVCSKEETTLALNIMKAVDLQRRA